eukprot:CAMPEP_0204616832 /NCGR_PEP_ID=MMETSP0717-20131115/3983_1 /ASSEMBLY_ACC=CAM_ASM_000666 /TAXON_ID=230516 /ORGANISM="Chaetoceros curvisetus" /LENGTH=181 /DNA_ID=CAMNT_0051630197 /DNA_START=118 /DNA_END=663 /DNA_ORIENTATION=-
METGTISSWKLQEGESFAAGDSLAEIETDKATIDFEAQDDGVVAKILVPAGTADVAVGVPVLVTVEEEDDVEAFKNFVVEAKEEVPEVKEEVPEVNEEEVPIQEPIVATPPLVKPVEVTPKSDTETVATPVPLSEENQSETLTMGPTWGNSAHVTSPLAALLSANQKKYIEKYGSTGQVPL